MSGLRVENPGLFTTIQDLGRPGYRSVGVPSGGAFDVDSFRLANALAGNPPHAAALELTLLGGTYVATGPIVVALAGAPMEARIEPADGPGRQLQIPAATALAPGDRLVLGGTRIGARTYLAVPGGFMVETLLGSRSREQPVVAREVLAAPASRGSTYWPSGLRLEADQEPRPLRVIPGPDHGLWPSSVVRVGTRADRMGIHLEAEGVIAHAALDPDRLSGPVAPGSVQWTGSRWIVLGVSGGTMGGYPVVAQVIRADLDRIGQLRPGDRVRLVPVCLSEAVEQQRARCHHQDRRDQLLRLAVSNLVHRIDRTA
ncbi:MAG: allophanate hydrolase [Isosphaeraceae bacterium]|nr:MAG: allophanate hydrolase [Isosphaeraceae bacterium]